MSLLDKLVSGVLDERSAAAVAVVLNADQATRATMGQPATFTSADVQRIAKMLAGYEPTPGFTLRARTPTASEQGEEAVRNAIGQSEGEAA